MRWQSGDAFRNIARTFSVRREDGDRSTSSNRGDALSFGCCPLSVSLLPRLTVSPSYDDRAVYTSGYLYLISSPRRCRVRAGTRRALGSGLPSAGRMATPPRRHTAPLHVRSRRLLSTRRPPLFRAFSLSVPPAFCFFFSSLFLPRSVSPASPTVAWSLSRNGFLGTPTARATFAKEVVGVVSYDRGTSRKKRNVSSAKDESSSPDIAVAVSPPMLGPETRLWVSIVELVSRSHRSDTISCRR